MKNLYNLQNLKLQRTENNITLPGDSCTWVDLTNPSEEELSQIATEFKINFDDLKDCIDPTERPRYNYDLLLKNQFLLLRGMKEFQMHGVKNSSYPIAFFLTAQNKLITIHPADIPFFQDLDTDLNRKELTDMQGLFFEMLRILFARMDRFEYKLSLKINELQLEESSQTYHEREIKEAFAMNSYLILFNTAMFDNLKAVRGYMSKNKPQFDQSLGLAEKIDDLITDLDQMYNFSSIYRNLLSNTLDGYYSLANHNLSHTMKMVASISLILMIPTLIASFYGMNVNLPGGLTEGDQLVFGLIIAVSFVLSTAIWIIFRKLKWL